MNPKDHLVDQALNQVPHGSWTTYGDLAEAAGTGARHVGSLMASGDFELAHRVLTASGRPSSGFGIAQQRLLGAEGVTFDDLGRADPSRRFGGFPH
ncbi:MAG: MGMT family protein [Propionibacterium sp.]|nr:MGMT family protein [Propionibacterium sp.]